MENILAKLMISFLFTNLTIPFKNLHTVSFHSLNILIINGLLEIITKFRKNNIIIIQLLLPECIFTKLLH